MMNRSGVTTWGDPCRECGFSWALSPEEAVAMMAGVPARFERQSASGRQK